jgi:hypothetical protein
VPLRSGAVSMGRGRAIGARRIGRLDVCAGMAAGAISPAESLQRDDAAERAKQERGGRYQQVPAAAPPATPAGRRGRRERG